MSPFLIIILMTFLAGILAVVGVYSLCSDLFLRDRNRVGARVDEEFRKRQRTHAQKSTLFKSLDRLTAEAPEGFDQEEERGGLGRRFTSLVEQSGLNLTPRRLLTIMAAAGLAPGALGALLFQNLLVGGVFALIGAVAPLLYVSFRRTARLNKLLSQLPDAFDLMGRVIRAGQTTSQAIQAVADEFEKPLSAEFAYCYEQQNLGLPPEVAYRDLARRTGLLEIKIFVLGLLVQQQTGGNLAELLEKLAGVVRERFRLRGKIKTLTAEGRIQAVILLALPPLVFLLMWLLNPGYSQVLIDNYFLLILTAVWEVLGALWIRKIINFDF
jgi:tight adherence protein B